MLQVSEKEIEYWQLKGLASIYFLKGQLPRFTTGTGTGRKAQKQKPASAFSCRNGFLYLLRFSSIY